MVSLATEGDDVTVRADSGQAARFHVVRGNAAFPGGSVLILLQPCCSAHWYVTEKGSDKCGSCGTRWRPESPADWPQRVVEQVFASRNVLEQEMLAATFREALTCNDPSDVMALLEASCDW